MNSENLILRETTHSPLVNKNDFLTGVDHDNNLINIYEDLLALCLTNGVIAYDISTTYDDSVFNYVTHEGKLWKYVNAVPGYNVTPGTNEAYWIEVFPTELAHRKNSDTILDEGGLNEVSASEIRAFIDAGLTSTTNLSLSEHSATSMKINSSTGTDVVLNGATELKSGLLIAEDKQKLNQISGINTGDQTLESLGAEASANKVVDFSTVDNITFPTTEAVNNQINELVPTVVDSVMEGYQKTQSSTALTFMFSGTNSDISTYKKCFDLLNYTAGISANNGGISTSTTPVLQVAFATEPSYPNLTVIPIGNILIHFETQKGAGSNSYHSYVEIYKRNLAGTEILLLTSDNSSTTASNDLIQNTVTAVNPALINLLSTDRLVFKIYSVMTSGTATITSYFDDATMTRVELPFVVDLTTYATLSELALKEDSSNKQSDLTASSTKFPTVNAVNTGLATKEPSVSAGTTSQYYRGDKSWQTLDKTAVGLGNVANVDTTNASNISSGTLPTARMGSGTADNTSFLRGDNTWQSLSISVPQKNKIYVDSTNGVDSTGRGRIDNPYLTVEYALSDNNNTGTVTATTTNNSNVLTSVSSTTNIVIGQFITGAGIPYDSIVTAKTSNTITLSRTCTASATITATWWTIYELQLNGNFVATSNWFKAGFFIDAGSSNISFGAFTLFAKTSAILIHESIKGGNWYGTNASSKFITQSTTSDNDLYVDINNYYSIGTGLQMDLQQFGEVHKNIYFRCKSFDARFGSVGYFRANKKIIIEGDFYGLLYGLNVRSTDVISISGKIETPASINALVTYGQKLNINANVTGQLDMTYAGGIFNGVVDGTTCSILTSQYYKPFVFNGDFNATTINISGDGNAIFNASVDCTTLNNSSNSNIEINNFRGSYVGSNTSKAVISSMQHVGNTTPFRNITLTNTSELIVINNPLQDGAVSYGQYPLISIASGCKMTISIFSYGHITSCDGTIINNGIFNVTTKGNGSGLMGAINGTLINNGTIELVRFGATESSLNTPTLIIGTGKYIQNGGKLFCSHADSKSGLIRKTASGGKVLLKGQPQLITANGLAPLQILSNTGTAQDVHNFGVITNGAVGFRIADTFSDTTYGTAYAPNLIGTATNNEDTTYNI